MQFRIYFGKNILQCLLPTLIIYAFALVMWEIGSRKIPYEGAVPPVIETCVKDGEREEDIEECPDGYMELIRKCWDQQPQNRPSIDEVIVEIEKIMNKFCTHHGITSIVSLLMLNLSHLFLPFTGSAPLFKSATA